MLAKQLTMLRLFIDAQAQLISEIESRGSISSTDAAAIGVAICHAAQITRTILAELDAAPRPANPNLN